MTIWQVYNNKGSIPGNALTNLIQPKKIVKYSSLEIKKTTYGDGFPFPDGLSSIGVINTAAISTFPGAPVNMDLLITFDWFDTDQQDGLITVSYGDFNPIINGESISLYVDSAGIFIEALLLSSNVNNLYIKSEADIYSLVSRRNWVKWANIDSLDFTVDLSNIAGERPMDWSGLVYKIIKLGTNIAVYGANGVSLLIPHDVSFGMTTISRVGVLNRNAVAGDEFSHYFIDSLNDLYKFEGKLEKLGYAEYLSKLTDPVITYDNANKMLYICDGVYGYVYSTDAQSFGEGPNNISGIGYQDQLLYIASPLPINIPTFELWTDIIDFGTRDAKTLHSVEIGIDLTEDIWVSIEFRMNKSQNFIRIPWKRIGPNGVCHIFCHGVEFRIGLKVNNYEYFELDSIAIEGRIT